MDSTATAAGHRHITALLLVRQSDILKLCAALCIAPCAGMAALLTLQVVRAQLLQLLCHKLQYVLRDGPFILCDLLLTVRGHLLVAGQTRQTILQQHMWNNNQPQPCNSAADFGGRTKSYQTRTFCCAVQVAAASPIEQP